MAISKAVIAIESHVGRQNVISQPVEVSRAAPDTTYRTVIDGAVQEIVVAPLFLGQVYFHRIGDTFPYQLQMYVAVVQDEVLEWAPADLSTKKNQFSGKVFNPMD